MRRPPPRGGSLGRPPEPRSPWQRGTDVEGVVPPGRRLSDPSEARPAPWSASGVRGVTPPGRLSPGKGPSADWVRRDRARKAQARLQNRRAFERSTRLGEAEREPPPLDLGRPLAGFVPAVFDDAQDPDDLEALLKSISQLVSAQAYSEDHAEAFASLIHRSHAPYTLVVAFTVLSAIIGGSRSLRRRHALALERGAKAFFNLARRLDPGVTPPRGLAPETLDALFVDLPDLALQVPYAYATDAFCRQLDLLRQDVPASDGALFAEARRLRRRFIERRAYGDRALREMFSWDEPSWVPPDSTGS